MSWSRMIKVCCAAGWRTRFAGPLVTMLGLAIVGLVPTGASRADALDGNGIDVRVAEAAEAFTAGDYSAMFERLAAAAREEDIDALRFLLLLSRANHPAMEHFATPKDWRSYVASTGSRQRFGTGWPKRLADLGDPIVGRLLSGAETAEERLDAVGYLASKGEMRSAFELAASLFHLAGGPYTDRAFASLADAGLHDAAGAALRARITAAFQNQNSSLPVAQRLIGIASFARHHWKHGHIGVVDGLADFMMGLGGPDALAALGPFTRDELLTLVAVRATSPDRWDRAPIGHLSSEIDAGSADRAARASIRWWQSALAKGHWLRLEHQNACDRLCPHNVRACDNALTGGVVTRGWTCLTPYGALVSHRRYRGSVAERHCLMKLFADARRVPGADGLRVIGFRQRFETAQRGARCLRP